MNQIITLFFFLLTIFQLNAQRNSAIISLKVDSLEASKHIRGIFDADDSKLLLEAIKGFNGTGFLIKYNQRTYIITCHHVIDIAKARVDKAIKTIIKGKAYYLKLVGGDSDLDLAVLTFVGKMPKSLKHLAFMDQPIEKNNYIDTRNGKNTIKSLSNLNPSICSKFRDIKIKATRTIKYGESGSPVIKIINNVENVIGIIRQRNTNKTEIGFVLPAKVAKQKSIEIIKSHAKNPKRLGRVDRVFLGMELWQNTSKSPIILKKVLLNYSAAKQLKSKLGHQLIKVNGCNVKKLEKVQHILDRAVLGKPVVLHFKKGQKISKVTLLPSRMTIKALEDITDTFFKSYTKYRFKVTANKYVTKCFLKPKKPSPKCANVEYLIKHAGTGSQLGGTYGVRSKMDMGIIIRSCLLNSSGINFYVQERKKCPKLKQKDRPLPPINMKDGLQILYY